MRLIDSVFDVGEMTAGLAHLLDSRTGIANRWSRSSLSEIARGLHVRNGVVADGLTVQDLLLYRERPRSSPIVNAGMTTSDFPSLLAGAVSLTISELYRLPTTMRTVAARRDRTNFASGLAVRLGRAPLTEIFEGGEVRSETLLETESTATLKTYGNIVIISRRLLINDDQQAISDAVRGGVESALQVEDTLLFGLLSANSFAGVTMSDGVALFHANHANTGTGVISATSLAAGVESLLDQRDISGGNFLDNSPRYLVCGPKTVITARAEVAKLGVPNTPTVLAEPRLVDTLNWYLFADPRRCAALEYGSLRGMAPQVRLADDGAVDGIAVRLLHDAGAWAQDWRPTYRSTGA